MFNEEDKIRWIELAPSLQDYIKRMIKENGPDYYNTHIKDVYNKISTNTSAISKESNERKQADKNLQSNIDANTANISKNKTNLDNEIKNRQNAINEMKSTVDKDLSAVKSNITKISDKIGSKEFVKVKNSADNIQIAYEQKDKEDKKNIHIYVNNTDIPITAAGGGGGLGAIPDYSKTKSFIEMVNYTNRATSFIAPTDGMITGGLVSVNTDTDYLAYYHFSTKLTINDCPFPQNACVCDSSRLNIETSSITYYGAAFVRKGDVISIKEYTERGQVYRTYYLYLNNGSRDYVGGGYYFTPLTRSITTSISGPIPDYSQKYSLHTFPNNSGTFTTTSPGDGYLLFYSDAGVLRIDDTLVSWVGQDDAISNSHYSDLHSYYNYKSLVPVKRNAKIEVDYENISRFEDHDGHTELYFVPLANGASTPSANLGLPDYTRGTNVNVNKTMTYKMPYDGCVVLPMKVNTDQIDKSYWRIYVNNRPISVDVHNLNLMKNDEIKFEASNSNTISYFNFTIHIFPYR